MHQERLFRLAVEDIAVAAHYEPGQGWVLSVGARRQDEAWGEAHREVYSRLTTVEMVDVLFADLQLVLGL